MVLIAKNLCVALVFVIFPFQVAADEITDVMNRIAAEFVSQLPMNKKIVLRTSSPLISSLPEDFLQRLSSDFEASLLMASDFQINLLNRSSTEELWSEATEFGDADFEKLYDASKADVALLLQARPTQAGIEINVSMYELFGDNSGQLLAASGVKLIKGDFAESLGVNLNTIENRIDNIKDQLNDLKLKTDLLEAPNSFVEYYHNYNIYKSRNNYSEALKSLSEAVKYEFFIDTMLEVISLSRDIYGEKHLSYLNAKVFPFLDQPALDFSKVYFIQSEAIEEQTLKYLMSETKDLANLLILPLAISQLPKGVFVKNVYDDYFIFESEATYDKFCTKDRENTEITNGGGPLLWNFDTGEFKLKSEPFVKQLNIYCSRILGLNQSIDHINIGKGSFYVGPSEKNAVQIMIDLMNGDILDAYNSGRYKDLFLDITKVRDWLPKEYPKRYLLIGFKGFSDELMYDVLKGLMPETSDKISGLRKIDDIQYWSARTMLPVSTFAERLSKMLESNGTDAYLPSLSVIDNYILVSGPSQQ